MTREEIINMLAQRIVNSKKITTMQDAVDYVLNWVEEHSKNVWKKPECDLPEYDKPVIGIFKDGSICECKCSPEERIWFIDILVCDEPILWINKPELPKGGKE